MSAGRGYIRYNVEHLQKVRDQIANHPELHDQQQWQSIGTREAGKRKNPRVPGTDFIEISCPTAACAAGWSVQMGGGKMLVSQEALDHAKAMGNGEIVTADCMDASGELWKVSALARELMGLTKDEGYDLFAAYNSRSYVLELLDLFIKRGLKARAYAAEQEEREKVAQAEYDRIEQEAKDEKIRLEAAKPRVEYVPADVAVEQTIGALEGVADAR